MQAQRPSEGGTEIDSAMAIVQNRDSRDSVQPPRHSASYLLERLNAASGQFQQSRDAFSLEQA